MRKLLLAALTVLTLTGCGNRQLLDTTYTFNKAIIDMQGTVIEVEVKSWRCYEGEQIQIKAKDGATYLVSSMNCTLIAE